MSVKELLNLVEYFSSYGQLKSITRWPTTAQMGNWEEGGLWRQKQNYWKYDTDKTLVVYHVSCFFLVKIEQHIYLAFSLAFCWHTGLSLVFINAATTCGFGFWHHRITKPIPPKTRSWPNLCRFSKFQLAITPKVFGQILKFFHRNAQKNLDWFLRFF